MKKKNTIILSGGGTMGSVTPLLALAEIACKQKDLNPIWVGTKTGPEEKIVKGEGIAYKAISSGKFRRYFSWKNFTDVFLITAGFFQSLLLLSANRPKLVMSAGGFVSVPLVWAAWLLRIPVIIHQLDIRPGLANKLMAPFAAAVTVTFKKSLEDYGKKTFWVGSPVKNEFKHYRMTRKEAMQKLDLSIFKTTVLVMGGGTGAQAINEILRQSLPELSKFCQVIHISGKGKMIKPPDDERVLRSYRQFEFLDIEGIIKTYTAADIVVTRAGMGVLTEISYLGKTAVIIPIPDSHQEENAEIFKKNSAAVVLEQVGLTAEEFTKQIRHLVQNTELSDFLSQNIKDVFYKNTEKEFSKVLDKLGI
jgi:UDP-N-acetylglucosamine--N-acetylmuramyl-(pentapeptide) pyrophosphoryl-undecaprenol N-acetylglucosamine transferase